MAFKEIDLPEGYSWDFSLENKASEVDELYSGVWERYFLEESDIADDAVAPKVKPNYSFYFWGIRNNEKLIAAMSLISLPLDDDLDSLPNTGWEFACNECLKAGEHNSASLLSAAIDKEQQGMGLSKLLVKQVKLNLKSLGYKMLVAPIRPSSKSDFPNISIGEYLAKKNEAGEIFDPWLRTHIKLGGKQLNICHDSYIVKASISKWESWTSLTIDKSAKEFIPNQALVPVVVNDNVGTYTEPNVWVQHTL